MYKGIATYIRVDRNIYQFSSFNQAHTVCIQSILADEDQLAALIEQDRESGYFIVNLDRPKRMKLVEYEIYKSDDGFTLKREYGVEDPMGNPIDGDWVYRDSKWGFICRSEFREQIALRYRLNFRL